MFSRDKQDQIEVGLMKRTVDKYTSHCLSPIPTGKRVWQVKVLSVCTDEGILLDNWKKSLEIQGYDYEVLGLGKKWGGWPWRTKQYIERLANEPEEKLFVLTDATDLFFIAPPHELIFSFRTYRSDVVIGAEHSPMTGPLRHDFKLKEKVVDFVKTRNPWTRYIVPNGGFVMGFRTPLLNVLCGNLDQEDDQHGYLINWLGHPNDIKLDIYARMVANIVYDVPFFLEDDDERVEMDFFDLYVGTNGTRVRSVETKGTPCAMHFPGGNSEAYNYFAEAIYRGEMNLWTKKKKSLTDTIKKSWAQSLKVNLIPKFLSSTGNISKIYKFPIRMLSESSKTRYVKYQVNNSNCDAHFKDCKGICGGEAVYDCTGVCYDPNTELPIAVKDCNGVCGGTAIRDCKGICNGDHERDCDGNCYDPKTENPVVIPDCRGICGGSAIIDNSGVCCEKDEESEDYDDFSSCSYSYENSHSYEYYSDSEE